VSTPSISVRTTLRDTVMEVLLALKGQSVVRVKSFAVSNRFLVEQETKQANTYCVIVTDEEPGSMTQRSRDFRATLKIIAYAYDTKDPHSVLDAMIEDLYESMAGIGRHPDLVHVIQQVTVEGLTTDEATTAADSWAQAVRTWSFTFSRV
jgi:hypothetical protein